VVQDVDDEGDREAVDDVVDLRRDREVGAGVADVVVRATALGLRARRNRSRERRGERDDERDDERLTQ
jgi:hypothetical protein